MDIKENYYCRDLLRKIKNHSLNSSVDDVVKESLNIDSIKDYHVFKKFIHENVKKAGQKDGLFMKIEFGYEGLLYGHRNAFFDHAGIETEDQRFIFPHFEHGADLRARILPNVHEQSIHSFVFQAPYKNEMIHRERPMCPVYNVGPYILYAKKYYDDSTFSNLKKSNGRTLLLFPAHTFEGAMLDLDKKKFVKEVLDSFKNKYDTILACVYWNDVDDPMYDAFEAEGVRLISAGFRGDPNFIIRLRAIIEMTDMVASNQTGSYIGYSMALNRPFYMFSERAKLYDASNIGKDIEEKRYNQTCNDIFEAYSSLTPSDIYLQKQKAIYNKFWGGEKHFKSKEEAREIIDLSHKLLKQSRGTTKGYEKAIIDSLNGSNKADLSDHQQKLLKIALGKEV